MHLRSALVRWVGGATFAVLISACAASAPSLKPTALPKQTTPPPAPKPAKERLLEALRQIERPAPMLDLLPPEALGVLDAQVKGLTAEQREQVLRGELARMLPLLHLKAGGSSAEALFALATTPVAAEELPQVFETAPQATAEERQKAVKLGHDLVQRAAQHFLRDRVLDVANVAPAKLPSLLADIERAALSAERQDVVRLALEAWAGSGATADVMARLAFACAHDEDEQCFEQALSGVPEAAPEHARLVQLGKALRARKDGDPIVKAWALLELGRYADARRAIAPVEGKAKTDLRVAAAVAVSTVEGSPCPGLVSAASSPRQCADAVSIRPGLAASESDMDAAWKSGAGRDAASAEAYVGFAHVVPWLTATVLARDPSALEQDFTARYQALAHVLQELPEQKPFAVFASAFAAGISAGLRREPGGRPQVDEHRKQELWFAALGVDAPAPRLAVAAVLASEQPVLPLLPTSAPSTLVQPRAGLLAWEAANGGDAAALAAARNALTEQLQVSPKGSLDASTAVLLLAELDVATAPSERTHSALAQVSSHLIGEPLPPDLALRAVLDAAGALERLGRSADALGALTKAAEIQAPPGAASDLLTLIRAEKLVLEWDAKKDPQRLALAKALAALPSASSPPTFQFVLGAYAGAKPRSSGKQSSKAQLGERIGVRAADQMSRGSLGGARVSLRVFYSFQTGLSPEVRFEPMLVPLVRPELIQKAL